MAYIQTMVPLREELDIMQNLQDTFLNKARQDRTPVTVFLTNGFQMRGEIKGFDNFVVLVDSEGKQQMIYKHAISTITPARPIDLSPRRTEV